MTTEEAPVATGIVRISAAGIIPEAAMHGAMLAVDNAIIATMEVIVEVAITEPAGVEITGTITTGILKRDIKAGLQINRHQLTYK